MMKNYRIALALIGILMAVVIGWYVANNRESRSLDPDTVEIFVGERPAETAPPAQASGAEELATDHRIDGVNEIFSDPPDIQKAWIERGRGIVLKNHPDAESANFRNTFFYRGFKYRPVTCGEVQFLSDGNIVDDYQRFIYVGIQSSHLERDVVNFDLLWDKLCVQRFDD